MPDTITQADRLIAVDTPLGPDVLLLRSFSGTEGISQPFHFHLDMLSQDFNIDFDRIVGKNVTVRVKLADDVTERYFNGYISRFSQLPVEGHLARYEAEMAPWLWFLTRTADCQIFQDKSVPDIIEEVFGDFGFSDYENPLQGRYAPRTYCVQYRETAANFVMRLMEEEGIFFFFRHEDGKHILVMGDKPSVHQLCPNQARARYEHTMGRGAEPGEDVVFEWRYEQELRPGRYALTDYNFETPSTSLMAKIEGRIDQGGNKKYEVYDYPGEYLKRDRGDTLVGIRMEEEETPHTVITGGSTCRAFATGFRFALAEHDRRDQNDRYVLTSLNHSAHSGSFRAETAGEGATYSNTFTCIPFDVPFRPSRTTPKPLVQGCQTAVVVGPAGEEIHCDKYGRVKVQFHWDREGNKDDDSSCWVRVSQAWAGKNWGVVFLPRIGQEVIVDFLEGDPDRPIITGRVYNAEQMPPYTLPANQTQSGIKTRSSKGGGTANFNELRFEDKKGSEQIYLHAERNLSTVVEASESRSVGGSRSTTIQKNETLIIKEGNRDETLQQGNDTLTIEMGNRECTLNQGNDALAVQMGDIAIKAPVGQYHVQANEVLVEATTGITLKCGMSSIKLTPADITVACGGSTIKLIPAMTTVSAPMVKLNC